MRRSCPDLYRDCFHCTGPAFSGVRGSDRERTIRNEVAGMTITTAAFIHSEEIDQYHYPANCPFKTERAGETKRILSSMGYYTGSSRREVAPAAAATGELHMFHTPAYLDMLRRVSAGNIRPEDLAMGIGTDETPAFKDLYNYSVLAAGGSLTAARLVLEGTVDLAFNPSGGYHHARPEQAGGFCYVNDVVLACMALANAGKRVLCLDIDAHHGNGTQEAFYASPHVFTISFHESGETLYPWGGKEEEIGEGDGRGYNVNMPFPAGTDDDAYLSAFRDLVPPLARAFCPDIVVLEIGMDTLSVDPLTHLSMTNNATADMLQQVLQFNAPIVAVGGGGYSPADTARGWALAWSVLCGIELEEDMYMGLGGVFLGSSEWNAGLRDKHFYVRGDEKARVMAAVEKSVESVKKLVFPVHGL
ncbi:MAG: hypothetical protein GF410_05240 [Chitinivibrionales bacterium]|nr:hypothetical protein [Chitinivibrionales bacterium]